MPQSLIGAGILRHIAWNAASTLPFEPGYSTRAFSRRINRIKFRWQVDGFCRIPQALHPLSQLHCDRPISDWLPTFSGDVRWLGKQLATQHLQIVLHGV